MKKLLYILLFNISAISFAQDPQLFENDWYLYKITIDNVDYLPPNLGDVDLNFHTFTENPYRFFTGFCDGIDVALTYDNQNTQLSLEDNPGFLIGSCFFPESNLFNDQYFSIFYQNLAQAKNPFSYIITTNGSGKALEISNPNGNAAFYGNTPLDIRKFDETQFSIHPNPAKNKLFLNATNTTGNLTLKIFNIEGKLLSTKNVTLENQTSIDVSSLTSGIYFLNIQDQNGNTEVEKFIKE